MELTQDIIERIVRLVIEELARQGMLGGACTGDCGSGQKKDPAAYTLGNGQSRPVITEETVKNAFKGGHKKLRYPAGSVVTPSAKDFARDKNLEMLPLS